MIKKYFQLVATIILFPLLVHAQKINYSEPDRDDVRNTDFEIIGKLNNHYLVYKHIRTAYTVSIFNSDMELLDKTDFDFLPRNEKLINTDIIAYHDFFYFIYQYQRKNVVYCTAAKIDDNGKIMGEPIVLDTTEINFFASNKIYNVIYSENKQRIGVYKVNSKNETRYVFTNCLFDGSLKLIAKYSNLIPIQPHFDFLSEFSLDNDGCISFVKASGNANNSGTIEQLNLLVRTPDGDTINYYPIGMPKIFLDDIRLKIDNINKHILITSFFANQKRGNIDGIYCVLWDKNSNAITYAKQFVFNDQLKSNAKSQGSTRTAFNDYFLQKIVMRKDGGFVILSESAYTSNKGVYSNRWDYMYGSPFWYNSNYFLYGSPYGYTYYPWMGPYGYGFQNQMTRYYADNVAIMSFDSTSSMEWTSIIPKSQYDDNTDNFIGYGTYVTPGKINFLYNQIEKRTLILQNESITPDGKKTEAPTLPNLDKGYQFMPHYAKQVNSREVLVPCQYRNYLCFARIEF
ncbi:MAG: hypothetical protein JST21_13250 [Bacteroidetes bacterium]|nr:hypothetical protein [Bacteroidota bacterium]